MSQWFRQSRSPVPSDPEPQPRAKARWLAHAQGWSQKLVIAAGSLLVACSVGAASPADTLTAESILVETPLVETPAATVIVQQPTPTPAPTIEPTPAVTRLVIWWPVSLAPMDNSEAAELLSEQISAFRAAQGNVEVQLRRKLDSGVGGIMSTLRTASPVAPGALPDLTLLRREDMQAAAQSGLIYPLDGQTPPAVLDDLYRSAQTLGQIGSNLYGLPYLMDVHHMAYSSADAAVPSRFEDILTQQISFALPAAQTGVMNNILLIQYLDAGGTLPANGLEDTDVEALLTVLQFYEQATQQGLIDPAVLNYTSPADYRTSLTSGTLAAGGINSSLYLNLLEAADTALNFGPIPTASGALVGQVDGWMWVMTTANADRQALAARFLSWMMDATRQSEYSQATNMIPSRRSALQAWPANAYISFIHQLLNNPLPLAGSDSGTIARAMQNALVAVLAGEASAEAAVQDLVNQWSD